MPKKKLKVKDLSFNFLPGWWAKHFGIKFGRTYYTDPEYRRETKPGFGSTTAFSLGAFRKPLPVSSCRCLLAA